MNSTYLRGDLYYADLGYGIGSKQSKYRPVVIVQNDTGNKFSTTVIIASITSCKAAKTRLSTHCYVGSETGFEQLSILLLEQLRTISEIRLKRYIGKLPENMIPEFNSALAISVGIKEVK